MKHVADKHQETGCPFFQYRQHVFIADSAAFVNEQYVSFYIAAQKARDGHEARVRGVDFAPQVVNGRVCVCDVKLVLVAKHVGDMIYESRLARACRAKHERDLGVREQMPHGHSLLFTVNAYSRTFQPSIRDGRVIGYSAFGLFAQYPQYAMHVFLILAYV